MGRHSALRERRCSQSRLMKPARSDRELGQRAAKNTAGTATVEVSYPPEDRLRPDLNMTEEMKCNEVFVFEYGTLTIRGAGNGRAEGWATIAFKNDQIEIDDGHHLFDFPPSELRQLRDFLNRVVTPQTPSHEYIAELKSENEQLRKRLDRLELRDPADFV